MLEADYYTKIEEVLKDRTGFFISLVGAGGKTTIMYELAELLAKKGKRVVVMTSTHICKPERLECWAHNKKELYELWQRQQYAVIGQEEAVSGKLTSPLADLLAFAEEAQAIILCEADGAKRHPLKAPRAHEPVVLPQTKLVIGVVGLDALEQPWHSVCFGIKEAEALLQLKPDERVEPEKIAKLILSPQGLQKAVENRDFILVLNKLDKARLDLVEKLKDLLLEQGLEERQILLRATR